MTVHRQKRYSLTVYDYEGQNNELLNFRQELSLSDAAGILFRVTATGMALFRVQLSLAASQLMTRPAGNSQAKPATTK